MNHPRFIPRAPREVLADDQVREHAHAFSEQMQRRRTVRDFYARSGADALRTDVVLVAHVSLDRAPPRLSVPSRSSRAASRSSDRVRSVRWPRPSGERRPLPHEIRRPVASSRPMRTAIQRLACKAKDLVKGFALRIDMQQAKLSLSVASLASLCTRICTRMRSILAAIRESSKMLAKPRFRL